MAIVSEFFRRTHRAASAPRDPGFFLQFSSGGKTLGRVIFKISTQAGEPGREFTSLITGERGYGYRGSRMYACCQDSWCLLGDILYRPLYTLKDSEEHRHVQPSRGPCLGVVYSFYKGCEVVCSKGEDMHPSEKRGNLVFIASDFDQSKGSWVLGPAFKIALAENPNVTGCVVGSVESGLEVLQELSGWAGNGGYEPYRRITISDCGAVIN
ncbi:peptidyl-prolyl cis-trans isomerase-like [Oratosquilla oratoria]|uniref:peptidyl-prolyl cis-trans isomerase-like n=1 Tax=Oratosquilla oratoria TaxID=337810 RepID=UPI003F775176